MEQQLVADRLDAVIPSGLMEMLRLGQQMAAAGRDVVFFAQGQPDFDTPDHIKEAAMAALTRGETSYAPPEGILPLREQVAARLERENGLQVSPESEVVITQGATMGAYVAMMATLNPGDEVLIFDPGFGPYLSMVGLVGGKPVLVPTREVDGQFRPDPAEVKAHIGPRTRALLLNSPANPTGVVLSPDELRALGDLAEQHDLLIFSDEVYDRIVFEPHEHVSISTLAPEYRERTIIVNSLSKTYAMTGWRVGYNVANPTLAKAMRDVIQLSGRCVPPFVQQAAITALSGPQDCVTGMLAQYTQRRTRLVEGLNAIPGLHCAPPEGTFYAFADAREINADSWDLARSLLEQANVVVVPGRHYGPTGEGHLRISFATSLEAIETGLNRLAEVAPDLR